MQWEDLFADVHDGEGEGEDAELESLNHSSVAELFDMLLQQGRSHVTRSTTRQMMAAGL